MTTTSPSTMACPLMSKGSGDDREPVYPIMPVPREGLAAVAVYVELDAVAVVFDFVNPLSPRRSFHLQGRQLGTDKARHGSCGFLAGAPVRFATTQLTKSPPPVLGADGGAV